MALSAKNKQFLEFLRKLDLDEYADKTFDGLFENIPADINYFLNWLINNITWDNVLTHEEQALYFELEQNGQLSTQEEMNYYLSSSDFTFEEVKALDFNYVNLLSQDLADLNKCSGELTNILSHLESKFNELDKKIHHSRSLVNTLEKKFDVSKQECSETNLLLGNQLENVKAILVAKPSVRIDINLHTNILPEEKIIFNEESGFNMLDSEIYTFTDLSKPLNLKEDLTCIEAFLVFSKGYLIEKKFKLKLISEFISQSTDEKSFYVDIYINSNKNKKTELEIAEEIRNLESRVKEKVATIAKLKENDIMNECRKKHLDFIKTLIPDFLNYKDLLQTNQLYNSALLHILTQSAASLENTKQRRSKLSSKLFQMESQANMDISNFEVKKQRFKALQKHQHPLIEAVKNISNSDDDPKAVKNIFKLLSHATNDSNFITHKFRINMKLSVQSLLDNVLRGPTNQLLFLPVDLMIKFQTCKQREGELSYAIKRLASKFLESKEIISKSDRKKLLLWVTFLNDRAAARRNRSDTSNI